MGDFYRQNSRVWWSSFPGANESDTAGRPWVVALTCPSPTAAAAAAGDEPADASAQRWHSPDLTQHSRGDISSPSQGSHGSQDSGFSDSELHNAINSPQDSPELSKRQETPVVSSQRKPSPKLYETSFPARNVSDEALNQIQNQLELSFQLPKIANSPQSRGEESVEETASVQEHTVIENQKIKDVSAWVTESGKRQAPQLDRDGFKIPKCVDLKGSCTSLNFSANPPLSCSTPKGSKGSPKLVRPARPEEKTKSFATVRKLKALSSTKPRRSTHVLSVLSRGGSIEETHGGHPVAQWLEELETVYEAEIMTTLQSKSLASDLARQVTNMAVATSDTVQKLHKSTKAIAVEMGKFSQYIKCKKSSHIGPLVQSLVGHVKEFITEYVLAENTPCSRRDDASKDVGQVLEACDRLQELVTQRPADHEEIDRERIGLAKQFRQVVDGILLTHVQALVSVLEEPRTELALRTALSALCSLGLEGGQLSELVARCEGVRALLSVILEARATTVRVSALRALATVCSVAETIAQFQRAGGLEILTDILADPRRPESETREAAAVLAQVTAPWIENSPPLPELAEYLPSLVTSLTRLVERHRTSETLLLSAAATANLTFLEPRTVWCLLENNFAAILLAAVRKQGPKLSVFIQEQTATVFANMAAIPEARGHLAQQRAVAALLCFLQIRHSPLQKRPEIAAAERLQQRTAIALSRLCSDATVAKQVVELQGIHRLVRLCKEGRERNHSDGVLVACLAALRKIEANCGSEMIEKLKAMDLIEPRLLDSFLLYSSKQESYV